MDSTEIQVVEDQPLLGSTSSQHFENLSRRSLYWTAIDDTSQSEQTVRIFPGKKVRKIMRSQIQFLKRIGKGGQGDVYNAELLTDPSSERQSMVVNGNYAVKEFKGKLHENHFGQWPEELFGMHSKCNNVCVYYGYSNDGESFCLLMEKYDCSLRDNIDKQMEKGTYKGRPFHGPIALSIIIQIAMGMAYLHQLDVIHRDLKTDNIFVLHTSKDDETPASVYIGDFDVAPTVHGTGFWRAPEILQALKDNQHLYNTGGADTSAYTASKRALPFTAKSDVYSFGMMCYEILTGGIPFERTRFSNYDVVLCGERPKLPANLNSKMVNLLNKCWHHDPDARPTFMEIVVELKGFVEGTEALMALFNIPNTYLNIGVELGFVELKHLVHVLVDKYGQEEFVQEASELVIAIEQFTVQFGMRSYKEHPSLPFYEGFSRNILVTIISLKKNLFMAACPQVLPEFAQMCTLIILIINNIIFDDIREGLASYGKNIDVDELIPEEEIANRIPMYSALEVVLEKHRQSLLYGNRHDACHELLTNKHHIGRDSDEIQPCAFCKDLPFYAPEFGASKICTFQLYNEKFATLKSVFGMTH